MAEIKIDPDKFLATLREALLGAVVKEEPVLSEPYLKQEDKPKKKSGRPPKKIEEKQYQDHIDYIDSQIKEYDTGIKTTNPLIYIEEDKPPPLPRRSSLKPTVRDTVLDLDGKRAKKRSWEPPKGPNKFVDKKLEHIDDTYSKKDPSKKVVYPPRADRREPAQEVNIKCERCHREFKDFPGSYRILEITKSRGEDVYLISMCMACICPS